MKLLKIENFEFAIKDYFEMEQGLCFDLKIDLSTIKNDFKSIYNNFITNRTEFDFSVDDKPYHGRFGQFLYDIEGNARLWIVTVIKPKDPNHHKNLTSMVVTKHHVPYYNLKEIVLDQEIKITALLNLLKAKNILTEEELNSFKPYLTPTELGYDIESQVRNLDDFLVESHETLAEIKDDLDLLP